MKIQEAPLWQRLSAKSAPLSFDLELTARCNNDCRHCYINLPAGDQRAAEAELSVDEILSIAGQAAEMGAVWCLLTGGEPLLREDFAEIFLGLKRLGLLVSVFTNACLVTPQVARLFKTYPPRDIEVSVYGATRDTYEAVTRRPGSYDAFTRGLDVLDAAGVRVRLKAMVLRSNIHEFESMAAFSRARTKDYYRFDAQLHLRLDGDAARNEEIKSERLTPDEFVAVERADEQRFDALRRGCASDDPIVPLPATGADARLLSCGAGSNSFTVGHDGVFRLCSSLCHPDTTYDLRRGTLREAWQEWVPHVRQMRSADPVFLQGCGRCNIVDLCMWCPAHAALETGTLDGWSEYFCRVAHARAAAADAGAEVEE